MTQEEKAKAYDEAIERAKIYKGLQAEMEFIFPELKESEDERISDTIFNCIYQCYDTGFISGKQRNDALDWLKKQGEQKIVVVPKFRVGDKVKKGYLTYTVEDIDEESYKLQAYSKDGDKGCTVFLTIGYEKDYELVEQKPVEWSEEDEQYLEDTLNLLEGHRSKNTYGDVVDWLKELKNRVLPQQKQEWSEEDKKVYNSILCDIATADKHFGGNETYTQKLNWLKSLRPQKQWKPTDLQIEALESATANCAYSEYQDCLKDLIRTLKTL